MGGGFEVQTKYVFFERDEVYGADRVCEFCDMLGAWLNGG